ncbi:MAG: Asp-tRNA(Asn)/Glu-tRNA(Gln) amidotransferase subunit GatC [bacterium]|nr:Asp-tRNA(Asn)/Glu-tRNA(Gln) amidotransferase subunit GatC [bacterium]MDZ4296136.1 Asp-tRNA(Asn)/Glu-tRNA(Gln) amidotransferase subunit GatC [Patescibacteria group bacterium]
MLTEDQIKHLALLARPKISPEEAEKYRADLVKILDYVSELQKVDTAGAEPLHNVLG